MVEETGPALWICSKGSPGRVTYPFAIWRPRGCSEIEAVATALARPGAHEGVFHLGDGRRIVSGVVVPATYVGSDGKPSRPPNPAAFETLLEKSPPEFVAIAWGAEFVVLLDAPVPRATAVDLYLAAARLVDAWLQVHNLRPEEYTAGKWRGGFVVDYDRDPLEPTFTPNAVIGGERRSATVWHHEIDLPTAEAVIRKAERTQPPALVSVPVVEAESRDRGVVGRLMKSFKGR